MPTRFKYIPVQSQNFALTPVEILMATDQELNEYMSVKKYAPYRKEMKWDSTRNDRLKELKNKVSERIPSELAAGSSRDGAGFGEKPAKKRKGKKERMKMKAGVADEDGDVDVEEAGKPSTEQPFDALKRKRTAEDLGAGEDSEGAHGKKKRSRKKKVAGEPHGGSP
jgi:protein KRI1